jgi:hypothetical protein
VYFAEHEFVLFAVLLPFLVDGILNHYPGC